MIWAVEHIAIIRPSFPSAKPRMLRWPKIKFVDDSFTGLEGHQVCLSVEDISEEETWLLETLPLTQQITHSEPDRSLILSLMSTAPTESPYVSLQYSPPTSVSILSSASTHLESSAVERILAGFRPLRERASSFEASMTERMNGIDLQVAAIEAVVAGQ